MKYGMTQLKVVGVMKPQTDMTAATPSAITLGEFMQVLDMVPGQSQMLQVPSGMWHSQMRLGLEKPQADNHIVYLMPDQVADSSQREIVTPIQPVRIYPSV